jgi:hypothetical protein
MRRLNFRFTARHITRREPAHGADLGIVARIEAPGESVLTKAALIQTKRLSIRNGVMSGRGITNCLVRLLLTWNRSGSGC